MFVSPIRNSCKYCRRIKDRPLRLEHLETRTVPTAAGRGAVGFDSLQVELGSYDSSSILVRFRDGAKSIRGEDVLRGTVIGKGSSLVPGLHVVELNGVGVADALRAYRFSGLVEYAEPNYTVRIAQTPNDPMFGQLDGLNNTGQLGGTLDADIDAPAAWDITTGSDSVVVAVIDSGVDYNHPDLTDNIWTNPGETANGIDDDGNGVIDDLHGASFLSGLTTGDPMDDNSHGTHVAGIIGAEGNNNLGVVGVAWDVEIMALKFIDADGLGWTEGAIEAFDYATMMRTQYGVNLRITSNSWGSAAYSQALYDAIEAAGAAGILTVAGAGNDGSDATDFYPASYDSRYIVSVAATDHNDQYASFSNYGATNVDLAAPGVDVLSTIPGGDYGTQSGTSMATPHVSGAAALVWSEFPYLNPLQVKARLLNGVDDISAIGQNNLKPTVTNGRLNALRALEATDDLTPPSTVTDLQIAGAGMASVTLTFTAPGDDGNIGTADFYDIRYSTSPIVTEADFASANRSTGEPAPQPGDATETAVVSGLELVTIYYFAMKVVDESGNISGMSNVVSAMTQDANVVYTEAMENGAPGWSGDGLWHLSNRTANSPITAFYYGDEFSGAYDTGFANGGALMSPAIDLLGATDAILEFWEYRQVEDFEPYDGAYLYVSDDGLNWSNIWADYTSTGGWVKRTVDVSPWAGGELYLQFYFETVDEFNNFFEGWYLDDIAVLTPGSTQPGLYVTNAWLGEVNNGTTNMTFTVYLVGDSDGASVQWETAGGSATEGIDYGYATGELVFGAGESSKTVTVQISGDKIDESSEVFFVNLSDAEGADIVDGQGQGTIIDDDIAGLSLRASSGLVTTEAGGTASLSVVLTSLPTGNVTVNLMSSDTAEATVSPATLTFTPANWNVTQSATLKGVNDFIADGNMTYFVNATSSSSDPSYNGLSASASAVNLDNDTVVIYSSNAAVNIPDPGTVISEIAIPDSWTILDVRVSVNITHGRDQDLDVKLITPWGAKIKLFSDVGGNGSNFVHTLLDDEAATAITTGTAPFFGVYRPEGSLSIADGGNTAGNWKLKITDDKKGGAKGNLINWSLIFEVEQPGGGSGASAGKSSAGSNGQARDAYLAFLWEESMARKRRR